MFDVDDNKPTGTSAFCVISFAIFRLDSYVSVHLTLKPCPHHISCVIGDVGGTFHLNVQSSQKDTVETEAMLLNSKRPIEGFCKVNIRPFRGT